MTPPMTPSPVSVSEVEGPDGVLVLSILSLLCLGAVMVFSATVASNSETLALSTNRLIRHLAHIAIGGILLVGAIRLPLEWVQYHARMILLVGLFALTLLFIPGLGKEVNGSLRWYDIAGISVQPSEFMKVAALIYFADYLARKKDDLHRFKVGFINVGIVLGMIGLLLLLQPDFGTTVVLVATVAAMNFLAGVRFSHFTFGIGVAVVLLTTVLWTEPYRVQRLLSYQDPWADPFGSGFQLTQALIAIGRGEWLGTVWATASRNCSICPIRETIF